METTLEACGFVCESVIGSHVTPVSRITNDTQDISQRILQTHRYDVMISTVFPQYANETHFFTPTSEHMTTVDEDKDLRSHRQWKNNEFYRNSVRKVSNNSFFFPTTTIYNLTCALVDTTYQCQFGNNASMEEASRIQTSINRFKTSLLLADKNATNGMFLAMGLSNWAVAEAGNISAVSKENMNATCSDVYTQVCLDIPAMLFFRRCSSFFVRFNNFL